MSKKRVPPIEDVAWPDTAAELAQELGRKMTDQYKARHGREPAGGLLNAALCGVLLESTHVLAKRIAKMESGVSKNATAIRECVEIINALGDKE